MGARFRREQRGAAARFVEVRLPAAVTEAGRIDVVLRDQVRIELLVRSLGEAARARVW